MEKYLKDVKRNYGKPSNPDVATEKDVLYIDIVELVDNDDSYVDYYVIVNKPPINEKYIPEKTTTQQSQ